MSHRKSTKAQQAVGSPKSSSALRTSTIANSPGKPKPYDRSNDTSKTKKGQKAFAQLPAEEQAVFAFLSETYTRTFQNIIKGRKIFAEGQGGYLSAIKRVCAGARSRDQVHPLPTEGQFWGPIKEAEGVIGGISSSPHTFDPLPWIQRGILSQEPLPSTTEDGKRIQQPYARRRLLSKEVYLETLEGYMLSYPLDAGWACARLACDGFGARAQKVMNTIMEVFGFNIRFTIDILNIPEREIYADWYYGISERSPSTRLWEDSKSKGSARHLNYSFIAPGCDEKWEIFTIVPLCQQVESPTEFRTNPSLSHPEAILVDLLPFGTNSSRGGFISSTKPPPNVTTPCRTLLDLSPHPIPTKPAAEIRAEASTFYDQLRDLFEEMRLEGHNVGPEIAHASFLDIKGELVDYANTVNGRLVSLTLMKDLTAEIHRGAVNGIMLREDSKSGRAVAVHQDMVQQLFDAYYSRRKNLGESLREFLGLYADFWALILIHRWFGLLLVIPGRLLRILNPILIHSWSSNLSSVFHRGELASLVEEMDDLPLSIGLLTNQRVKEMQHAQKEKKFLSNVGKLTRCKTGGGQEDISLVLVSAHPGHQAYRPSLCAVRSRLNFIVSCMSLALNRIAATVASQEAASTPKRHLLDRIEREFEELCIQSGVKDALEKAREDVVTMERGHAALLGRFVSGDILGTKQGNGKERKKMGERNCGPRAIGVAGSEEREAQLMQWRRDAEERVQWKLERTYIGPKDLLIEVEDYENWFMGVAEGKSFLYSANAMANANPFDVGSHSANQAAARRVKEAEGQSWEKAEFERAIPDVALALSKPQDLWENSPAWVRCSRPGCGGVFLSASKNAKHRCEPSQIGSVTMVTKQPDFVFSYLRLLYPHDLVGYPGVSHLVTTAVMEKYEWVSAPASRFLVDGEGNVLPEVPKGIEPRLVKGTIWYREKQGRFPATSTRFRLAMAVDIAVREASQGEFGPVPYNTFDTQPWEPTDPRIGGISRSTTVTNVSKAFIQHPNSIKVRICKVCLGQVILRIERPYEHGSCGASPEFSMKVGSQTPSNFHEYVPERFIDLPYANMRCYVYLALALGKNHLLPLLAWEK